MVRLNQARLERAHVYHKLLGYRLPVEAIPSKQPPATLSNIHEDESTHDEPAEEHFPASNYDYGRANDDEPAPVPSLRFPLIVENPKQRDHLYEQARRQGLGISRMYPDSIDSIAQLQGQVIRGNYPSASKLAQTLLTLPTHPLIFPKDQKRIIRFLCAFCPFVPLPPWT